jgi:hypothetical protein
MSKSIDLNVNGRLFPSWILKNFKKFRLPEIIRKEGEDPCNEVIVEDLNTYQKFVGQYLSFNSPFKDLLVFHGLGSGKTVSAINIYNVLYNFTPKWNVFLLIPASLREDPWMKDLSKWLGKEKEAKMKNVFFVHYDSPIADKDFLEKVRKKDASRDTIYIFDEAHKFMVNVYNNISSKKGKRAQVIYDYIKQEKIENRNTRIVLLTATPVVNNPFEYALIFNLLRPGSFPNSEAVFNQMYISSTNFVSINDETRNMFQRRILGLVSYYIGATPDKFAQKTVHYKNIIMSDYHEQVYNVFEEIEEQKEKLRRQMSRGKVGGDDMSTYASYTRQACNFVFPEINERVNGEGRPRPGKFRITDKEELILNEGRDEEKMSKLKQKKESLDYLNAITEYIDVFKNHLNNINEEDEKNKHTLITDVEIIFKKYNGSLSKFLKEENKKSKLFTVLYDCGPKYIHIIFNLLKSKGPVLVYSNYVEMEGLAIFKIYLSWFKFMDIDSDEEIKNINKDVDKYKTEFKNNKRRYMEFHGSIDRALRTLNKEVFNNPKNKNADIIKIIMISPAGAEGLNLKNVRQVHIVEPYWNEVKIEQVIGRAIRICSHKDLPMEERKVDVFRYKCVRKDQKETSDEKMEDISRKKNNLLLSFTETVKEASVDCELFKAHNMMGSKYRCFQFNQQSLFDDVVGPAYERDMDVDSKIADGLNAMESVVKRIKVREISGVELIGEKEGREKKYWLDDNTNVVYDYETNYVVGKLKLDDIGNPSRKSKDVYYITNIIQIPEFQIFE